MSSSLPSSTTASPIMKTMVCVTVALVLLLMSMSSSMGSKSPTMAVVASAYEIHPNGDVVEEGTKKVKLTTTDSSTSSSSSSSSTTTTTTKPSGRGGGGNNPNKEEWPELVGINGEDAKRKVEEERPDLNSVQVVPSNAMVTMDYRQDRVRIFVDPNTQTVTKPPRIG